MLLLLLPLVLMALMPQVALVSPTSVDVTEGGGTVKGILASFDAMIKFTKSTFAK
jgi:hypothetical protein